jgi:hypothetical protein
MLVNYSSTLLVNIVNKEVSMKYYRKVFNTFELQNQLIEFYPAKPGALIESYFVM